MMKERDRSYSRPKPRRWYWPAVMWRDDAPGPAFGFDRNVEQFNDLVRAFNIGPVRLAWWVGPR